jgi:hypothetical protein
MKMGETSWSTAILENLIISKLFKEFPALFEPEFLLMYSLYTATALYPEPVESSYPILLRFNLILLSKLPLHLISAPPFMLNG